MRSFTYVPSRNCDDADAGADDDDDDDDHDDPTHGSPGGAQQPTRIWFASLPPSFPVRRAANGSRPRPRGHSPMNFGRQVDENGDWQPLVMNTSNIGLV